MSGKRAKARALVVWAGLWGGGWVGAQEELVPEIRNESEAVALPFGGGGVGEAGDDEVVLVEAVGGIRVLGGEEEEGLAGPGVVLRGLKVGNQGELAGVLGDFLHRGLTERDLLRVTDAIANHYEANDVPVVEVWVPEQEVPGTLVVRVAEGRAGRVKLRESRYFDTEQLAKGLRVRGGDWLRTSALERDLAWLSRNPFRQAELFAAPGEGAGVADLLIGMREERPWRFYAGFENTGTEATGEGRILAGAVLGNVFGLDQVLAYQATLGWEAENFRAHGVLWEIPLHGRQEFVRMTGSWAWVRSRSGSGLSRLLAEGESWQVGVAHGKPVDFGEWRGDVSWGVEFKRSDTFLAVGETVNPGVPVEVAQARVDVMLRHRGENSRSEWRGMLVASPGGVTGSNGSGDFEAYRLEAEPTYFYARVTGNWLRPVGDWMLGVKGQAQVSSGALLPTEQLGFGGAATVRGYDEREVLADRGGWGSIEMRSPTLQREWLEKSWQGQALVFLDQGWGWREGEGSEYLLSMGIGMRLQSGPFSLRADLGQPLADGDGPRAHVGLKVIW